MNFKAFKARMGNDEAKDFLDFDAVEPKLSQRPDLHAFLLLDQLVPGTTDIISNAEHDQFYLSIDPEELAAAATGEQVTDLIRCGVIYDEETDSLFMFT